MALALAGMIGANHEQAGELALRPGIGLERNPGKACNLGEPLLQLLENDLVAARLAKRSIRMNAAKLRPGDGGHFHRGVQFHRAGAKRDHGSGEREVARFQALKIAKHFRLGMIPVEDRMGQVFGRASQRRRVSGIAFLSQFAGSEVRSAVGIEDAEDVGDVFLAGRLIQGNTNRLLVNAPEIHPVRFGQFQNVGHLCADFYPNRIKVGQAGRLSCVVTQPHQPALQNDRQPMNPLPDQLQTLGTVIAGVKRRHVRQQRLRGANVARGLFAPNVLLARLEGQTQRLAAA